MAEKIFVSPMYVKHGNEKAPWVKAKVSFKVTEMVEFLEAHAKDDGFVNIDICESKDGTKLYGVLNQWTANKTDEPTIQMDVSAADQPF